MLNFGNHAVLGYDIAVDLLKQSFEACAADGTFREVLRNTFFIWRDTSLQTSCGTGTWDALSSRQVYAMDKEASTLLLHG
jgi:hypothetical protein